LSNYLPRKGKHLHLSAYILVPNTIRIPNDKGGEDVLPYIEKIRRLLQRDDQGLYVIFNNKRIYILACPVKDSNGIRIDYVGVAVELPKVRESYLIYCQTSEVEPREDSYIE
jgi:hypothetical protein